MIRFSLTRLPVFVLAGTLAVAQTPAPPAAVTAGDVIAHLAKTISWYRHVDTALDSGSVSGDPLLHGSTHGAAIRALQLAFDFARAESTILSANQTAGGSTVATGNLSQGVRRAAERMAGIQARMKELDAALSAAPPAARAKLVAQRNELEAQRRLADEVQKTLQTITSFAGSAGGGGVLANQIAQLEALAPEARRGSEATTKDSKSSAPQGQMFQPESAGLLTLATQFLSLTGRDSKVNAVIGETDQIVTKMERLRSILGGEIRRALARSEELTRDSGSESIDQTKADQREIEGLTDRFRQISAATVPLREQQIMMSSARTNLNEIRDQAVRLRADTTRYLLLRSTTLGAAILILLSISAVWRRATFRYIRDSRRRRQFMLLRRVVVTCAVMVVLVLGFISDFGSLATYAGFLTAGIAVALQNVILAIVAYFFLIGRYGVRIGDRVTISGVTGNVIDVGLVRMYLMEFAGTPGNLHPTGRIVVFSNAVLFQPSALYKQMPGADFIWRTVTLTLQAECPLDLAREKLSAAVDSVFETYRVALEQQHAELEQSVDLQMSAPRPDVRLRYSDTGLEFTSHYPAELHNTSATDDRVMKALHDAITNEPRLALAPGGAPKLSSEPG